MMESIWIVISGFDDHDVLVEGVFDNEQAANECLDAYGWSSEGSIYKVNLANVQSSFISTIEK